VRRWCVPPGNPVIDGCKADTHRICEVFSGHPEVFEDGPKCLTLDALRSLGACHAEDASGKSDGFLGKTMDICR